MSQFKLRFFMQSAALTIFTQSSFGAGCAGYLKRSDRQFQRYGRREHGHGIYRAGREHERRLKWRPWRICPAHQHHRQPQRGLRLWVLAFNTVGPKKHRVRPQHQGVPHDRNQRTAIGTWALHLNTVGSNNTAAGYEALRVNTSGASDTSTGAFALNQNQTVNIHTADAYYASSGNTTGIYNATVGAGALL